MDTFADLDECITQLAPHPVPVLRHTLETYREMVDKGNDSTTQLTNLVLTDPGLTISLFREAISVPRKNLHSDIRTVDQAMLLLGSSNVGKLIERCTILEEVLKEPALSGYKQVVSRSYHSAYQAFDIARNRSDVAPDEIFAATMVQETAALVLWLHRPQLIKQIKPTMSPEDQQQILGFSLNDLTRGLAEEWGLSAFIQQTMDPEAVDDSRVKSVDLGVRVGLAAETGWESKETEELLFEISRFVHTDMATLMEEIRGNAELAAEETPFYEVEPAINKLPPAEEEEEKAELDIAASPTPAPKKEEIPAPPPIKKPPAEEPVAEEVAAKMKAVCPIPHDLLHKQIGELKRIVDSERPQLPQLMSAAMHAMHEGTALNRAVFMMLTKDKCTMVARFVMGTQDVGFKKLSIKMGENSIFDIMMDKSQSLWVKDENRAKVWPKVPPHFAKLAEVDSFFFQSVRLKGKPVGLFYADRYGNDYGLDQNAYNYFRKICQLAAKGLLKLSR